MQNSTNIYVELLEEGTPVWRPVAAELQADGSFLISEQEVPKDEQWQFLPGKTLLAEAQELEGREVLVAMNLTERQLENG